MVASWSKVSRRGAGVLGGAAVALAWACSSTPTSSQTPKATSPAASPSATPAPLCTASGPASASWPAPETRTGGTPPIVSAVASGDTFTLTFDRGTPAFDVRTQPTPHFTRDPSGQPVDLPGSAGLLIVLRGFRGDMQNYSGPKTLTAHGRTLTQASEVGDFEGVVSWALGLAQPGCAAAEAGSSTLTFQVAPLNAAARVTVPDVEAVARQVFRGDYPTGCTTNDATCPLTPRLAAKVFAIPTPGPGPGPLNPFCRCQNPASRSMNVVGEVTATGGVGHVTLYPDVHPVRIDLIMVVQDRRLLVDDMQCTGKGASSSVYAPQLVACG